MKHPRLSTTLVLALALALALAPRPGHARELTEEEIRGWLRHISAIQQARRRTPTDPDLLIRLADAYGRIGDLPRAVRTVRRAERAGAPRLQSLLVEADALRRWGHNAAAIPLYLEVLDEAPAQTYVLVQLWRIAVEEVVSGREASPAARELRGRLRAMGMFVPGSFAPSADAAAEAARLTREARMLVGTDQAAEAIVRAEQALSQDPGFARAFEVLWRAHRKLGEEDRALGACAVYLELAPDGPAADRARDELVAYFRHLHLGEDENR